MCCALNSDFELVGQAPFETPGLLSVDPATDLLYVGRSMMAVNPPQRIGAIVRSDMSVEELDVFFPRPHALVVDAEANRVFSASLVENRIAIVDGESGDPELASVGGPPHTLVQFALSPDRAHLVATTQLTGKLLVFNAGSPRPCARRGGGRGDPARGTPCSRPTARTSIRRQERRRGGRDRDRRVDGHAAADR